MAPAPSPATGEPDGPAIGLIIGDAAAVAASSFAVPEPVFGLGPYVMLPDMTYIWRVRVTSATASIAADDPSWSAWSEEWTFRTRPADIATITLGPPSEGAVADTGPTIIWSDADPNVFYYEVQLSADQQFRTGADAVASVYWNLVHGGESVPAHSWTVPLGFELPPVPHFWRVRPRIQGDGAPLPWTSAFSFSVPVSPGHVVINEVSPEGDGAQGPWAELLNHTGVPISLEGATLSDEDGNSCSVPAALPQVPPGAFVLVYFDGLGSDADDYDFGDGQAVLHTPAGIVSPFEEEGDQLALYRTPAAQSGTLLDFVAWGEASGADDDAAVTAGLWHENGFVQAERGGEITGVTQVGESLGLFPGRPRGLLASWVMYAADQTTPGRASGIPTTEVVIPSDGAVVLSQDFYLA